MLTINIRIKVHWDSNKWYPGKKRQEQIKKAEPRKARSFFDLMERERERLLRLGRYNTAANYRTALNSFRQFRQGKDLTIGEITPDLMVAYEGWLRDRGIAHNTSSCYMRALRAVYNRMVDQAESAVPQDLYRYRENGSAKIRERGDPAAGIVVVTLLITALFCPRPVCFQSVGLWHAFCRLGLFAQGANPRRLFGLSSS